MRRCNFKLMMGIGTVAFLLAGCKSENMHDPSYYIKHYEEAWTSEMGEIDPNQNFNMAKEVTANVNLSGYSGNYELRVYTGNPVRDDAYLVAKTSISGAGSISFDIPTTLTEVFVAVEGDEGLIVNGYYPISNNVVTVGEGVTRADGDEVCTTSVEKTITSKGEGYEKQYLVLQDVKTESGSVWKASELAKIAGSNGAFAEHVDNYALYSDVLEDGVVYEMENEGSVTLDYIFSGHTQKLMFGYYYYTDEASRQDAKLYLLMEDAATNKYITINGDSAYTMALDYHYDFESEHPWEHDVQGTKFTLAYFDENGTPSYYFPEGTKIEFFLINVDEAGILATNAQSGSAEDYYHQKCYFSTAESQNAIGYPINPIHPSMAVTYNYSNTTFIGFEDREDLDFDMNDMLFILTGKFKKPRDIKPVMDNPQTWIFACEDLGAMDDFDFNDIVFSVTHVAGSDTLTFKPLAAGGTLQANVWYSDIKDFGEIHALLGVQDYTTMINTSSITNRGDSITFVIDSEESFSISKDMGKFKVRVTEDDAGTTETVVVGASEAGKVPQMICVPGTWKWPKERINIKDAYPQFNAWAKDYNYLDPWYNYPEADKVVQR